MSESILTSIKKLIGLAEEDTSFDLDLIIHINTVFFTLNQLGVGPEDPFRISGADSTWDDFDDIENIEAIKTYIFLRVKLVFDPPSNSALITAMKEEIREYEFRLNVAVDTESLTNGF